MITEKDRFYAMVLVFLLGLVAGMVTVSVIGLLGALGI